MNTQPKADNEEEVSVSCPVSDEVFSMHVPLAKLFLSRNYIQILVPLYNECNALYLTKSRLVNLAIGVRKV
jgi:Leucine-rich repeat (LRR) protein